MKDILLVDGYNVIGDWPELKELKEYDLAGARDKLIQDMAEYQAYKGWTVKVIFDAHMVPGLGKKYHDFLLDVIYTKEKETADERIERLVSELKNVETRVHVATSDYAEQSHIFGSGALRKSSRELRLEMQVVKEGIARRVREQREENKRSELPLSEELTKIFDKWRRGDR